MADSKDAAEAIKYSSMIQEYHNQVAKSQKRFKDSLGLLRICDIISGVLTNSAVAWHHHVNIHT